VKKCARQCNALLEPSRELPDGLVSAVLHGEEFERPVDLIFKRLEAEKFSGKAQVFAGRQLAVKKRRVRDKSDCRFGSLRVAVKITASKPHFPFARMRQSGQGAQQSGLPRPVGTEEEDGIAARNLKANSSQSFEVAKIFGNVEKFERLISAGCGE